MKRCTDHSPLEILHEHWGYSRFRPMQEEVITSVLEGRDTLALMPTGGGKSITFQVPALMIEGVTLVISPLVALMIDQVDDLSKARIRGTALHSGMTRAQMTNTLDTVLYGNYKLLYISPERLRNEFFLRQLSMLNVAMIVVDECHCISQWGYDFRPDYLRLADIRRLTPDAPVLALTATATPDVVTDIQRLLKFRDGHRLFRKSFYRRELSYVVRRTADKPRTIYHILSRVPGSALLYVRTRKQSTRIAAMLRNFGISATYYHAGLPATEKKKRQQEWQEDIVRVMVCTTAFGMGINKPDVRLVLHPYPPTAPESYYQEAGRAGRDNQRAYAVLLYSPDDDEVLYKLIDKQYPPIKLIKKIYEDLCNYFEIAVGTGISRYFELDPYHFAHIFGHQVQTVKAALNILYLSGYMEYLEDHQKASTLIFTVNRSELYHMFTEAELIYDDLVELLLREYTGIFTEYAAIDEYRISQRLHLTPEQLYTLLKNLKRWRIIDYRPGKRANYVRMLEDRVPPGQLLIPKSAYSEKIKRDKKRLDKMIEYIDESEDCRAKVLMTYFGEESPLPCGYCDYCLAHPAKGLTYREIDSVEDYLSSVGTASLKSLKEQFAHLTEEELHRALQFLHDEYHPVRVDEEKGTVTYCG